MNAIIWGSSSSLPAPLTSASIYDKIKSLLWEARGRSFDSLQNVERYLSSLPHSARETYKGKTSCIEIDAETESIILCDIGSDICDFVASSNETVRPQTYHIFLYYLHWDNLQRFPFFTPAYNKSDWIIFPGFYKNAEQVISEQIGSPTFPFPFDRLKATINFNIREPGSSFEVEGVRADTIQQKHPGISWGYGFSKVRKRIVYS